MTLDELMNDTTPRIQRYISTRPQDGYVWNEMTMLYHEGDELFRERVKAMYAAEEWRGPTHEGPTGAPNIEQDL